MKKTFTLIALLAAGVTHAQFPTSGLFASYPLDFGSVADATGSNHGTATNTQMAMNRNGVSNRSLYFNGSSAYVNLGSNNSWNLIDTDGITVSAWVNTTGSLSSSLAGIVTRWAGNATADQFAIFLTQNTHLPFMAINPPSNNGVSGSSGLTVNEWHHVVMTYNRTGGHHAMYLDGVAVYSQVLSGLPSNPTNPVSVMIGAQAALAGNLTRYFRGYIDDVNIWSRPLTEAEVLALYVAEGGSTPCQAVAVNQHPQSTGICAGTSSATLSVAVAEPTASIQWQFNSGGGWGDMTGETGLTVEATAAGQYRAIVTADCGSISQSNVATVHVLEPEVPVISDNMGVLSVPNTYLSYQWLLDEQNIPGANSSSHTPTQNGHYGVIVTQTGGNLGNCTYESDMYHFTGIVTGINDVEGQSFTVFPNPFTNEMTVEVKAPTVLTLHNVLGAKVMSQAVNGRTMISTETLPAGVYFLRDAASASVVRVVKQ